MTSDLGIFVLNLLCRHPWSQKTECVAVIMCEKKESRTHQNQNKHSLEGWRLREILKITTRHNYYFQRRFEAQTADNNLSGKPKLSQGDPRLLRLRAC